MEFPLAEVVYVVSAFLIGINVGSFLNVVVGRLPLEKSILWPNSRCLFCLHPLALLDNLPLVGWLMRRGRCRYCGTPFSSRYLWVELFTGLCFGGLFYLDVLANWQMIPFLDSSHSLIRATGFPPWEAVVYFLHHAVLLSFLLACALCDWDHKAIPLSLTTVGTIVGLLCATFLAWPFPNPPALTAALHDPILVNGELRPRSWSFNLKDPLVLGLYPWPVWGPLPDFLVKHSWIVGLLTGVAGAAAGMLLIRAVKFTFEKGLGKEALGLGDADLMMMAGAFVGWQPAVTAFFIGAIVSLPLGVIFQLVKKERAFPFGPGLALGVIITLFLWPKLGPVLQLYLFEEILVFVAIAVLGGGLFVGSIVVRVLGFGK